MCIFMERERKRGDKYTFTSILFSFIFVSVQRWGFHLYCGAHPGKSSQRSHSIHHQLLSIFKLLLSHGSFKYVLKLQSPVQMQKNCSPLYSLKLGEWGFQTHRVTFYRFSIYCYLTSVLIFTYFTETSLSKTNFNVMGFHNPYLT